MNLIIPQILVNQFLIPFYYQQIFSIPVFGCSCEIEAASNQDLPVNDHDFVVGNGMLTINHNRYVRMGKKCGDYIDKLFECTNNICTKYIFAGSTRIAKVINNQISFYHPDHQGSTSVITNASGDKIEDISYYPFGETRQEIGPTNDKQMYNSQELDREIGIYNYTARSYDPEMGRFITPDSIVSNPNNPQTLNRYSYVMNNPLNRIDPSGNVSIILENNGTSGNGSSVNGNQGNDNSFTMQDVEDFTDAAGDYLGRMFGFGDFSCDDCKRRGTSDLPPEN